MADNYIAITCQEEKGSIHISEEVIAVMVTATIAETEGVSGLSNTVGSELAELLGKKGVQKGIKIQFAEDCITVDAVISVRYGCAVTKVAQKVQEQVASAIESMTGLNTIVNVHVSGVTFDKQ